MTVTADALDLLAGDPPRTHKPGDFKRHPTTGAPYVTHPYETTKSGTGRRVMYGRPSSFGAALDNAYNLVKWKERQLLIGVDIIYSEIGPLDPDDRDALDGLAARCHAAAGSHLAADQGTFVHRILEECDRGGPFAWQWLAPEGEALGIPAELQARIVEQWLAFRERLGLTALAVEQTVVNDRWRLAGTLDRLDVAAEDILTAYGVIDAGQPFVGDIKTGGLTTGDDGQPRYWVKYGPQLAAYVDAVPYNTETDEREEWPRPNPDVALIYHYDLARALDGELVDWQAIPVNVAAGREGGDLCRAAADFAKRRDLFAMPAPTIAAPVAPQSAVEQPVEPEPSAATQAVPGSTNIAAPAIPLAEGQPVADPEPFRSVVDSGSAATHDRLRARIADLIWAGHEPVVRRHWPEGVAPLSKPGHTDAELEQILAAVRRVEAEVGAPWHPDDGTPPSPVAPSPAPLLSPATVPDEGDEAQPAQLAALHNQWARLDLAGQELATQIAAEAYAAGRSISVSASPTVRRWSIARALIAWAASGRPVDELWCKAAVIATHEQCEDADATLGGLLSTFTIEQADALYEAAT